MRSSSITISGGAGNVGDGSGDDPGVSPGAATGRAPEDGVDLVGGPGSPGFDAAVAFDEIKGGRRPDWMSAKDWDQMQLQQEMQDYMKMVSLMTNLLKMQHEATMAIVRNISS